MESINLEQKGALKAWERLLIARSLQVVVLDELARAARWSKGRAVFHGGTSIGTVWSSPRHSEDLDFMVARRERSRLSGLAGTVVAAARARMAAWLPGSVLELSVKGGQEDAADIIDVWKVHWAHPMRLSKVLVKVEFYFTDQELLARYLATFAAPRGPQFEVSVMLPVAELLSLWADKAKAIATRPAVKWRDLYDIAFVASALDRRGLVPTEAQRFEALRTSAAIYAKTPGDVALGLTTLLDHDAFDDLQAFERDMERWYPPDLYEDCVQRRVFAQMLQQARQEVERAVAVIRSCCPQSPGCIGSEKEPG